MVITVNCYAFNKKDHIFPPNHCDDDHLEREISGLVRSSTLFVLHNLYIHLILCLNYQINFTKVRLKYFNMTTVFEWLTRISYHLQNIETLSVFDSISYINSQILIYNN